MAEVQAMKMALLRASASFSQIGDHKRAADMAKKYFEGFPHMNFAYDAGVVPFINVLVRANEFDEAKKHLRILAKESDQYMRFYNSLDADVLSGSFQQDMSFTLRGVDDVLRLSNELNDPDFTKEMSELLGQYSTRPIKN